MLGERSHLWQQQEATEDEMEMDDDPMTEVRQEDAMVIKGARRIRRKKRNFERLREALSTTTLPHLQMSTKTISLP